MMGDIIPFYSASWSESEKEVRGAPAETGGAEAVKNAFSDLPQDAEKPCCRRVFMIGGGARIRTLEGVSQQIYSLPSLTA